VSQAAGTSRGKLREGVRGGRIASLNASLSAAGELIRDTIVHIIDWFAPGELEPSDRMRARLIVIISAGLALWGPIFALLYLNRVNSMTGFVVAWIGTLWVASVPLVLRLSHSLWLAGNAVILNLFLAVTYLSYLAGGQGAPPLNWIVALPILAISLAGRSSGLFWASVGLLDLVIFYMLEHTGYQCPQHLRVQQRNLLELIVLTGLLALLLSISLLNEAQKLQIKRTLTERQSDLREAAARLHAIVNYAPDAIVTFNTRGIIESFNPAAQRLFLYTPAEVIGKPLYKLLPPPVVSGQDPGATQMATEWGRSGRSGQKIVVQRRDRSLVALHVTVGQAKIGNRPVFTAIMREIVEGQ